MNYLQITQRTCQEAGLSGTVPTAVTNQTGELKRFVNWAEEAYTDIQNMNPFWRWMRVTFTLNTVASDDTYAYGDCTDSLTSSAITRFDHWMFDNCDDPPKAYLQSSGVGGEYWLEVVPWEWFKSVYKMGTQTTGAPAHITVDPQNNIVVGPSPDAVYVITGDYHRSAQVLAADADTPEMPTQFHKLIVYKALEKYGYFESAAEVVARAQKESALLMGQLRMNQLSSPVIYGTLA